MIMSKTFLLQRTDYEKIGEQLQIAPELIANKLSVVRGLESFTTAQLKTIQEVITLAVFSVFSVLYLHQPLKWNYFVGFAMMIGTVAVIFKKW